MSIVLIAVLLWLLTLAVLTRVVAIGMQSRPRLDQGTAIWIALIVLATAILFRPHEDLYGGQDPGAYVNSAATYARLKTLSHVDPLLIQMQADERPSFLFGHHGYVPSKDGCMLARDLGTATIAPWFQPAYSIMMGAVTWILPQPSMLYVSPLFGLLTGIALAVLAGQLLPFRGAPIAAFLFYIFNPNTLWHARCPRPEMGAGFLMISAGVLLIHCWRNPSRLEVLHVALASAAMCTAVLIHISALFVALPIAIWVTVIILSGRPAFISFPLVGLIGASIFIYEHLVITDGYRLAPILVRVVDHIFPVTVLSGGVIAMLALAGDRLRARGDGLIQRLHQIRGPVVSVAGLIFVAGFCGVCLATYFGPLEGGQRLYGYRPLARHMRLTDIERVVAIISPAIGILGLVGWTALLLLRPTRRHASWVLAVCVLPGILLVSKMPYAMYYTRRAQPFLIPMLALSLTALLLLVPPRLCRRWKTWIRVAACAAVLTIGLWHRLQFITVTEFRGFARFMKPFAEKIRADDGILLCEYSRIAAPFDHYFGIPTLGIDNEHHNDYSLAERGWDRLMSANPGTAAFFITPFQTPRSARFRFERLYSNSLTYSDLIASRALPRKVSERTLTLTLYRMHRLADGTREFNASDLPYHVELDSGGMGLLRFGPMKKKTRTVEGIRCAPDVPVSIGLTTNAPPRGLRSILAFFFDDSDRATAPVVTSCAGTPLPGRWIDLGERWFAYHMQVAETPSPTGLTIRATSALGLTDLHMIHRKTVTPVDLRSHPHKATATYAMPMHSRWARANAEVLMPHLGDQRTLMLFYARPGQANQRVELSCGDVAHGPVYPDQHNDWQWFSYMVDPVHASRDRVWIGLSATPPYDPHMHRWPDDLGVLLAKALAIEPQ